MGTFCFSEITHRAAPMGLVLVHVSRSVFQSVGYFSKDGSTEPKQHSISLTDKPRIVDAQEWDWMRVFRLNVGR